MQADGVISGKVEALGARPKRFAASEDLRACRHQGTAITPYCRDGALVDSTVDNLKGIAIGSISRSLCSRARGQNGAATDWSIYDAPL